MDYRVWLSEQLEKRKTKNPSYSQRSFARTLGVHPSSLSQVLLGKRPLTLKAAKRISDALSLDPSERQRFMQSAVLASVGETEQSIAEASTLRELELDKFKLISEWYHLAILALASLKENRSDSSWIAEMLYISQKEARGALQRLERVGILGRRGKRFFQKIPFFQVAAPAGSTSIRRFHHDALQLAEKSLERDAVDEREFNTITMAIDVKKLAEAKKRIIKFRDELCSFLETGEQSQVYMLSVQLFPISKKEGIRNEK